MKSYFIIKGHVPMTSFFQAQITEVEICSVQNTFLKIIY